MGERKKGKNNKEIFSEIDFLFGLKQSKEEPDKLVNLSEEERVDVDGIVESVYEKIKAKISAKKALEVKLKGNI